MKKFSLLIFLITSMQLLSFAQGMRNCSTMHNLERLELADPSLRTSMDAVESFTNDYIISHPAGSSRVVVTIPVVVHVIYNTSTQNISDAQINSQLTILNNDFRKLNADRTSVPSVFSALSADCEINFCLAQRTPSGISTTGIVRVSTATTSFIDDDRVKSSSTGGDNAWDATQYLNIWVCNLGGGLLGYAQFPGGAASTDGVVINYTAFGNIGTAASPYNLGRTATHEIGHWLNLRHIWGDATCGSDLVTDTPTQSTSNFGCPTFPHVTCSNGPNGDLWMNYMDYTDDRCMYMFTTGQKTRMQALFSSGGARAGLVTSSGCTPPLCTTPSGLTATGITSTTATLNWTAVTGASSYNVQYKLSTSSSWTTVTSSTNTKALTGLVAGSTYNYQIQTVCSASSSSAYSTASSFSTTAAVCSVPSGLSAGSITTTTATLSWTAVTGATSYNVQYKLSTASGWTTVTSSTNSKALTGLVAGSIYNYQIQTVCSSSSSSAYSTASTFNTASASCATPTGLSASAITTTTATLSWTSVAGATSYNVQYKLSTASSWTTVTSSTTSKALTGLVAGSLYNFQIQRVCSASSSSAYSTAASFSTTAPPCTVPSGLASSSITSSTANLGWTAVSGAVSYNIQYKLSTTSSWTTLTASTNSLALTGLTASSAYNYQVQTVCAASSSAYSTASTFTTAAPPCTVPTGLSAGSITSTTATLSWTAVSGATSYNIQYKLSTATSWTTVTSSTNSKALTGLVASSTYNYQIQTVCSASSSSAYATASTFTTLAPPCGADTYEPNNSLSVANPIANNTNYLAYICPTGDEDWYRFTTTTSARNFRVTLTTLPVDYDLYVYNSSGTLLGSSTNGGTTSELYALNGGTVGNYYIRVVGYSGATSPTLRYTLLATTSSSTLKMAGEQSDETIVDIVDENTGFTVYPNPATDHFIVSYTSNIDGVAMVKIYDSMGKLITVSPFSVSPGLNQIELNTNEMNGGFYFIELQDGDSKYSTKILISK